MELTRKSSINQLSRAIRRPGTWLLIALFLLITLIQYAEALEHPSFLAHLTANAGLTRYSLERILYLLPIIWAGILFGRRGGLITSLVAVACMLPRAIFISSNPEDAFVETTAVFVVGTLLAFYLGALRKEQERRFELESAQQELQSQLRVIEDNEKRLAALNQTSTTISQSLDLTAVLDSAVSCVMDMLGVEVVRIYILDEEAKELTLSAYRGVSEASARILSKIKVGEGNNGRVVTTGQPLFVQDKSEDSALVNMTMRKANLKSQLIVPMRSKGKVVGTLSVAMHNHRHFLPEEADLLTAIGNQIGVSIENARLYQQEKEVAEQLRASEQRYRELFENANDAIWLHDLEGNVISVNKACVGLTGYTLDELCNLKISELISGDTLVNATEMEQHILRGGTPGSLVEVKLLRKEGTEALVQLSTSLVFSNGHPVAVQQMARDVTEERRMQENLRFLLQQITRAQEEERRRLAHELHDDTVQALVVHVLQIDELASSMKSLPKLAIPLHLAKLHQQADKIMQGVRRLSQDLRPATLDRLGLLPALKWLASSVVEYSGLLTKVQFIGTERRLPDEVEVVLFRIAQEALRNVWKHAEATSAEVTVEFEEKRIRITVKDDGKGFAAPSSVADLPRYGMLGLAGMLERARLLGGTLTVRSELEKGTTVTAELPV